MNNKHTIDPITEKMISFIKEIGLPIEVTSIDEPTFLPGIEIINGGLKVDPEKLSYPGDILHEAGHLAVMPPDIRSAMTGTLEKEGDIALSGEMMSMAWSYAAALHLDIDPTVVFHSDGYHGGGYNIVENFSKGHYFGLPMLQWVGLCYEPSKISEEGKEYFPKMIKWLREG